MCVSACEERNSLSMFLFIRLNKYCKFNRCKKYIVNTLVNVLLFVLFYVMFKLVIAIK